VYNDWPKCNQELTVSCANVGTINCIPQVSRYFTYHWNYFTTDYEKNDLKDMNSLFGKIFQYKMKTKKLRNKKKWLIQQLT